MPRASRTGVRGLYRDPDGRYRIDLRWRDATTSEPRRHKERLPAGVNAVAAKRRALEIVNAVTSGTYVAPADAAQRARAASEGQLGAALARYHEHNRTRGLRTHAGREAHGKLLVEVLGADRSLASLVPLDVERVRKRLRDDEAAPATCNRYLATIKHFARWAEEIDGTMPGDVASRLRKVRPMREPPGRVRYVKADEEGAFASLTGWLRPIVDAARVSGMRLSELTSLRWNQIDFVAASIDLGRTKNGKRRVIPVTPALATVLAGIPRGQASAYVFPVPERTTRARGDEETRRRDAASDAFRDWREARGLADLRLHDMRHDFATRVRRAGEGLDVVAALLGHSSLQMSARYAHLDDAATRAAAAKVGLPVVPAEEASPRAASGAPGAIVVPLGLAAPTAEHVGPEVAPASRDVAPALPPAPSPRRPRDGRRTPRIAKIQGVSGMGHLGLEPRANGLRVRCSTN
jgi:integrase